MVVDNFSNDGSAEVIEQWLAEIQEAPASLLKSPENTGFSGGNNMGMRYAEAEFYLLLNSDTLLREKMLESLLNEARANPDFGLYAPRLEWPDETPQQSCFRFHTPISEFIGAACTGWVTIIFKNWEVAHPVSNNNMAPQWASFACILLKGKMVKEIGLMDEDYFLYYEDADYCRTAQSAGWRTLYTPCSRVVHLRGGTSPVKSDKGNKKRLPAYYYASRTRYFYKHYGLFGLIIANILWYAGRAISKTREIFGRSYVAACDKQYQDIWTRINNPLKRFRPNS